MWSPVNLSLVCLLGGEKGGRKTRGERKTGGGRVWRRAGHVHLAPGWPVPSSPEKCQAYGATGVLAIARLKVSLLLSECTKVFLHDTFPKAKDLG